jgi:hypothetical protein
MHEHVLEPAAREIAEATAEPHPDPRRSDGDADGDPVSDGVAALEDLAALGVEVDGEVRIAESTWVLYGRINYDGEIIVGEYHDAAEASAVLRAAPRPATDHDTPPPPSEGPHV